MFAVAHCDDLDALNKEKEYEINQMSETVVVESVYSAPPALEILAACDRPVGHRSGCVSDSQTSAGQRIRTFAILPAIDD